MRVVFIGAGELSVGTARLLITRGHEVIIVETDRAKIDELSEELDCSFIHGDGSTPPILREVGPEQTDVLFCLSNVDQDNIIASLVGRSLGFERVVTSIGDREFEEICGELGLEDTINPTRTISRYLADMAIGVDILELSTIIKDEARFFSFTVDRKQEGPLDELELPDQARLVCYYRNNSFHLPEENDKLEHDDEVVILTHSKNLPTLREEFLPEEGQNDKDSQ